jgi:hypothetical protein
MHGSSIVIFCIRPCPALTSCWICAGIFLLAFTSPVAAKKSPLAASSPLLSGSSSLAASGADVSGEAKIIAKEAASIRSKVAGLNTAVLQAKHTLAAAKGEQLAAETNVQKMKAAVHAAAALKKAAISHALPTAASVPGPLSTHHQTINWGPHTGPPPMPPKEGADAKYSQPVTKLEAHGLFAKGPYIIMALLASILITFCCCAFSGRPTSMSNKYDMR